ncbi:hypothetical protein MMC06_001708 [Schaereria dolodes]|nr:hypothetical protein [Schaereria dolodes]
MPFSTFGLLSWGLLASFVDPIIAQQGHYFILEGGNAPLVIERLDPIVSPGATSGHVHSIVGGNGFQSSMNFAQAQTSTCSTMSPKADKSNYWMPNVYFQDPSNGSFIRVPELPYHKIYYKYGTTANTVDKDIVEFPQEFRMIGGSYLARSENATAMGPYGSQLGWVCHGDPTNNYKSYSAVGFPTGFTSCPGGLAAALTLPSCWNGQPFNIASPSAHMAYPVADGLSGCPAPHNVARFPQIFVEYWLQVDTFNGLYSANHQPFVLSSGDPTGYGYHIDFLNGWNVGALKSAMPTCQPGNTFNPPLSDPSCFGKLGGTYTSPEMAACTVKPTVNENVGWTYGQVDTSYPGYLTHGGVLDALPGCNPIQYGPANAQPMTC